MLPALLGSHPLACTDSTGGVSATGGSGTAAAAPADAAASVLSRPPFVAYASKSCCKNANRDQPQPPRMATAGVTTNAQDAKRYIMDRSFCGACAENRRNTHVGSLSTLTQLG